MAKAYPPEFRDDVLDALVAQRKAYARVNFHAALQHRSDRHVRVRRRLSRD